MMVRASLAALLALMAFPALAYCPSVPDDGSTGYVANTTNTALCLQRELAVDTSLAAEQARIDAQLNQMQLELQKRQMQAPVYSPTWPPL